MCSWNKAPDAFVQDEMGDVRAQDEYAAARAVADSNRSSVSEMRRRLRERLLASFHSELEPLERLEKRESDGTDLGISKRYEERYDGSNLAGYAEVVRPGTRCHQAMSHELHQGRGSQTYCEHSDVTIDGEGLLASLQDECKLLSDSLLSPRDIFQVLAEAERGPYVGSTLMQFGVHARLFWVRHHAAAWAVHVGLKNGSTPVTLLKDIEAVMHTVGGQGNIPGFAYTGLVHGAVWQAIIDNRPVAAWTSKEMWQFSLHMCGRVQSFALKFGLPSMCVHGIGHGAWHVAVIRSKALEGRYSPCTPLRLFAWNPSREVVRDAEMLCDGAPTSPLAAMCAHGLTHSREMVTSPFPRRSQWSWMCQDSISSRIAVGCFSETLLSVPFRDFVLYSSDSPFKDLFAHRIVLHPRFTASCLTETARAEHVRLGCIEAMSAFAYPAFDEARTRLALGSQYQVEKGQCTNSLALNSLGLNDNKSWWAAAYTAPATAFAPEGTSTDGSHPATWCSQYVSPRPGTTLDARDVDRWSACMRGCAYAATTYMWPTIKKASNRGLPKLLCHRLSNVTWLDEAQRHSTAKVCESQLNLDMHAGFRDLLG